VTGLIVAAMRQMPDSEDIAKLAVASRHLGVVGFDLAGPEAGFPNGKYQAACHLVAEANLPVTVHAGEGDGTSQIWQALHQCDAKRIGHGVRIIEDTTIADGEIADLGPLAAYVRDLRVPLEVSVLSNLHTGIYPTPGAHPVGLLHRAGFAVTINTDNRLMSGTSMTAEFELLAEHHGFGIDDFHAVTRTALGAGFGEWPKRQRFIGEIDNVYRELGSSQ
jgi:adenosine deaminase